MKNFDRATLATFLANNGPAILEAAARKEKLLPEKFTISITAVVCKGNRRSSAQVYTPVLHMIIDDFFTEERLLSAGVNPKLYYTRIHSALKEIRKNTLIGRMYDLVKIPRKSLLRVRNCGPGVVRAIERVLVVEGIMLK